MVKEAAEIKADYPVSYADAFCIATARCSQSEILTNDPEFKTVEHADEVLEKAVQYPGNFAVPELFAFELYSVLQRVHPSGLQAFTGAIIPLLQGGILRQPMT